MGRTSKVLRRRKHSIQPFYLLAFRIFGQAAFSLREIRTRKSINWNWVVPPCRILLQSSIAGIYPPRQEVPHESPQSHRIRTIKEVQGRSKGIIAHIRSRKHPTNENSHSAINPKAMQIKGIWAIPSIKSVLGTKHLRRPCTAYPGDWRLSLPDKERARN